jgi:hypothetical protein
MRFYRETKKERLARCAGEDLSHHMPPGEAEQLIAMGLDRFSSSSGTLIPMPSAGCGSGGM